MVKVSSVRQGFDIRWVAQDVEPINERRAKVIQTEHGYNFLGYGLYEFVCSKSEGLFTATWVCSSSCD